MLLNVRNKTVLLCIMAFTTFWFITLTIQNIPLSWKQVVTETKQ